MDIPSQYRRLVPAVILASLLVGEPLITVSPAQGQSIQGAATETANLPGEAKEIPTEELARLVAMGPAAGNYFLVDSRPASRYNEAHIPTAISLPLAKMEETGATYLPSDAKLQHTLLIFYCEGPT